MTRFLKTLLGGALIAALAPLSHAADLRIGVVPGAYADSINAAAKDAKAKGLNVEVIEFTDWTTPNVAVDAGDIDINYFQHQPFLENANAKQGFKLVSLDSGILANIGLYSLKHKRLEDVPVNGKVGLPSDPVNQGRGLLLLQKAGLITLKPDVGYLGGLSDIVENPRKLQFVEVEGPQLVRITGDVDLSIGYPHFIVAAKAFDPSSALVYSGIEDTRFAIRFVVHEKNRDDPRIREFIRTYHESPAVREVAHQGFSQDERLYALTWLAKEKSQ